MTDEQIIKALECCKMPVGSGACNNCPLDYQREKRLTSSEKSCTTLLFDYTLDLINLQRAEIDELTRETIPELRASLERANQYGIEADKEIERKDRILESYALQYGTVADKDVLLKRAKAEAVKEFAKKTEKMITEIYNKHIFGNNDLEAEEKDAIINFSNDVTYRFGNLVKEMVGVGK